MIVGLLSPGLIRAAGPSETDADAGDDDRPASLHKPAEEIAPVPPPADA